MIVGQNALLNQYVPTFFIKNLTDGQGLRYDSIRKAFVNEDFNGGGGASRLGELLDVSNTVDNPLSLQDGQALVYNSFTSLWENKFIDYNTLINKPTIGTGSVTSINVSGGTTGLTTTGGPVTTAGTITLSGTLSIANGGTGATTASAAINALLPTQSSNTGKFLTTDGTNTSWVTIGGGTGTVTNVSATGNNGVTTSVLNPTTSPSITIGLGNITPLSVSSTGTITASNLSGTNTGDQTITLTGDVGGSGTGSFVTTLATVNLTPGTYGTDHLVPTITVNNKGLVTSITTQHVDTTVRDLVPDTETFVVAARHQYIVTGELEIEGLMINNGVIAIL
jgi:hypothetical protein